MGSKEHISNVNWRKVIDNFRFGYQHRDPCEILITELMANSIDADADRIWIEVDDRTPRTLRFTDNGKGMSKKSFQDYHNLGSLTKHKGSGIGWAGIGAKLYIDRCQSIFTETRSATFQGASDWRFPKSEPAPIWKEVSPRGLCPGGHGTTVEVAVAEKKDCGKMTSEMVSQTILCNYNFALKPVGMVVVTINDERVVPFDPAADSVSVKDVDVRLKKGASAQARFYLLNDSAPPGFSLISVVVHGKTVGEQYDFHQFARISEPERIAGYVRCGDLIQITTTSKDNFNKRSGEWRDFDTKVGRIFSEWLSEVGHMEKVEVDKDLEELAQELQDQINGIFKLPEIRELDLDLFQNITRRLSAIQDPSGLDKGVVTDGQQTVAGTMGGSQEGEGVPTYGDEAGAGVKVKAEGDKDVTQRERRLRGGIRISYNAHPDRLERAWPDPGLMAIVINTANPAFRCADFFEEKRFYTVDECLKVVCETIPEEEERTATLDKLFRGYLKVTGEE